MNPGYSDRCCAERIWYQSAFLLLAFIPVLILAYYMDSRELNDIAIWVKPIKFHVSVVIHLLTFAILVRFLPDNVRNSLWLSGVAIISASATIIEIMLIDFQASRGLHSHFNQSSVFDAQLYGLMGVAAVILSLPALILGIHFVVARTSDTLTPGLKLGSASGLILGFVLTLGIAGYMSAQANGHWVAAPATDNNGLPIVGWTRQGGDLRVPHFFATHLMQLLPLAGYLLDKWLKHKTRHIQYGVMSATLLGLSMTVATFLQALAGKPFIQ